MKDLEIIDEIEKVRSKNNINWMLNSEKYIFTSIKDTFRILISLLFRHFQFLNH